METFSALLALCAGNSPVTGEFPAQRPVTRSFDVFFDLRPNKRLSKQSWGWWFEMPLRPLWCHCNDWPKEHSHNPHYVCPSIWLSVCLSRIFQLGYSEITFMPHRFRGIALKFFVASWYHCKISHTQRVFPRSLSNSVKVLLAPRPQTSSVVEVAYLKHVHTVPDLTILTFLSPILVKHFEIFSTDRACCHSKNKFMFFFRNTDFFLYCYRHFLHILSTAPSKYSC